jgi:general secretion pathway protein G
MASAKIHGFTIVELLIVIVVIGVLASISVASFGGMSTRAEDSAIASKVTGIAKLVQSYAAVSGGYAPQADWACVGEPSDYPAENGYTAEWCHQPYQAPPIPTGSDHPINPALNTELKTVVNRVPSGRIPEVDVGGGTKYRGILYDSAATQNAGKPVLQYYVKGVRTTCPSGVRLYAGATYTVCEYRFTDMTSITGN